MNIKGMDKIAAIGHVNHGKTALVAAMVDAINHNDRGMVINGHSEIGDIMDAMDEEKKDYFKITALPNYAELYSIGLPPTPKRLRGKEMIAPRTEPKVSRNSPCPCGSGKKSKRCCN